MDLMLTNGYNRLQCSSSVCPLATNRIAPPPTPVSVPVPVPNPTNRPTPPPMAPPPIAPVPQKAPSSYFTPVAPPPAPTVSGWRMTNVGSKASRASMGSDGTLCMVDASRNIWSSSWGSNWAQYTGSAIDIAVINKSRMYSIGGDQRVYRWTGSNWNAVGTNAKSISAASDGTVAVINSQFGTIWVKTGYDDNLFWRCLPYVFGAVRVAVVANNWLYYIGSDGIIYYHDTFNLPVRVGHSGVEISAGSDGSLVTVNTSNDIWLHNGGKNVETWSQIPGKAKTATIVNSKSLVTVASDGTVTRCDYTL